MQVKVYTLEQAETFFLTHSVGSCICSKNGEEKECKTYKEAKEFFEDEEVGLNF